ncbi:MAG TPA: hypothetical protein DGB85_03300 [Deltaproteobacteria bacterium]|nr:hypothetical protein [Deltaproteobacteria bacterium]|tara:strand:+ start:430 stop:633 length:204 start_codon:yes stop_codon:yes gene_type:complete
MIDLAKIGATLEGGVSRVVASEEDRLGRDLLRSWASPLTEDFHFDEVGNMFFCSLWFAARSSNYFNR